MDFLFELIFVDLRIFFEEGFNFIVFVISGLGCYENAGFFFEAGQDWAEHKKDKKHIFI